MPVVVLPIFLLLKNHTKQIAGPTIPLYPSLPFGHAIGHLPARPFHQASGPHLRMGRPSSHKGDISTTCPQPPAPPKQPDRELPGTEAAPVDRARILEPTEVFKARLADGAAPKPAPGP